MCTQHSSVGKFGASAHTPSSLEESQALTRDRGGVGVIRGTFIVLLQRCVLCVCVCVCVCARARSLIGEGGAATKTTVCRNIIGGEFGQ